MLKICIPILATLLIGCGSGLCPVGTSYRTYCTGQSGSSNFSPAIGILDTSFNSTGISTIALYGSVTGIALQSDGKVLISGYANPVANFDFIVARFNSNGSVDTSFGTGGYTNTPIGALQASANAIVLQPDGKIILGGSYHNGANNDFALARYNSNGVLDTSFNTTGIVTTPIGANADSGIGLNLQPDGKILLAGYSDNGVDNDFAIVRYNTNGSLDTTFNTTGIVTTPIGASNDIGYKLAIQSDGKIVVGGETVIGGFFKFALARYNSNGSLDTTFNTTGIVTTAIGAGDDRGWGMALQSDGKILLVGASHNGANNDFAIARYNTNGSLDTTFNTTGKVTTAVAAGNDEAYDVVVQPDGKILVAGEAIVGGNYDVALVRYNSNGSLDTTFNSTGKITTPINATVDTASCLVLQPDGKILVGGNTWTLGSQFVVLRYR